MQAKSMVRERGPVTQLVGEFHKSVRKIADSGVFTKTMMDNLLLETPIHAIDTVFALADSKVAEVHAIVRRATSDYKDVHAALILFENGCVGSIIANYTTDARLERYEIHGEEISIYLEGVNRGIAYFDGSNIELEGDSKASTVDQDRFFLDCVRSDCPIERPAANLDTAVETMDLALKILEELRE